MERVVGVFSLREIEELVKDVPNANLLQGVFLKIINTYIERHQVVWFGCRRVDWREIALLTVQQTVDIRTALVAAGKLVTHPYAPPFRSPGMAIRVHTTLANPPLPNPDNVYIYEPEGGYGNRGRG